MSVLFVHFADITALGGVESMLLRLGARFTRLGWRCGIVDMAGRRPQHLPSGGVPTWSIDAPSEPRLRRPRSWASFARAAWQFRRVLDDLAPDIVHVLFPAGQCLPVVGAHSLPHRWRLVATVLGSDVRGDHPPDVRAWQTRLLRRADAVTAVSDSLRDDAVRQFPIVSEKIDVIHNGVDCSRFDYDGPPVPPAGKYFLFLGRLHPVKQVDLLLRAWAQVRARAEGAHLRVVGDGPEHDNLRALAERLNLGSSVRFDGSRPDSELPSLYRQAEAVILPSRREGLPLTLLEAGASGTLMIGTNVPGISDVIQHGVTGYLVDPDSPEALGAAMLAVLQLPPEQRREMQLAGRERVRSHFSEDGMISAYEQLFQSLLQPPRRDSE